MCFEFEYLYWAKLQEEARLRQIEKQRGEEEQRRRALEQRVREPAESTAEQRREDQVPA